MCAHSLRSVFNPAPGALETKARESGKPVSNLNSGMFFTANTVTMTSREPSQSTGSTKAPPRLVSDQMINIFFQEWAPLFPVLHRPTFLKVYDEYMAGPEGVEAQPSTAQIYLIFAIAAVSAEVMSCEFVGR